MVIKEMAAAPPSPAFPVSPPASPAPAAASAYDKLHPVAAFANTVYVDPVVKVNTHSPPPEKKSPKASPTFPAFRHPQPQSSDTRRSPILRGPIPPSSVPYRPCHSDECRAAHHAPSQQCEPIPPPRIPDSLFPAFRHNPLKLSALTSFARHHRPPTATASTTPTASPTASPHDRLRHHLRHIVFPAAAAAVPQPPACSTS